MYNHQIAREYVDGDMYCVNVKYWSDTDNFWKKYRFPRHTTPMQVNEFIEAEKKRFEQGEAGEVNGASG